MQSKLSNSDSREIPTPESNIEDLLDEYGVDMHLNCDISCSLKGRPNLVAAIQALLITADQAGYTRGRGEATEATIRDFEGLRDITEVTEMAAIKRRRLQKEAKSNG